MSKLTHLDEQGAAHMVDVSAKDVTRREATAVGHIAMSAQALAAIRDGALAKGDALAVARIAGIMAAKRTSDLIPLCHPLPISHAAVTLEVGDARVEIRAEVATAAQTGVEMEALTAASVAALTVYDMAKAIDKGMTFEVELVEKVKE